MAKVIDSIHKSSKKKQKETEKDKKPKQTQIERVTK